MPKAFLNGIRIHYTQFGRGPDVVMVHGLAANLAFWNVKIVPALVSNFRVTTYDLRGHGYSDMPSRGYTSSDMVKDLYSLLNYLGVEQAHLVGHSFGGAVVLEYAVFHPEHVLSLTLADAVLLALYPAVSRRAWQRRSYLNNKLKELGTLLREEDLNDERLLEKLADPRWKTLRQRNDSAPFFVPFGSWNGAKRMAKQWRLLLGTTSALEDFQIPSVVTLDQVRKINHPSLAIFGARSRYLAACRELQRNLPNCRTTIIPGVGHFHPIVKPEAFAQKLQEFLLSPNCEASLQGKQD